MTPKKTLIILRHAKAETGSPAADDHARPLSAQGVEEAQAVAQELRRCPAPSRILCSTAQRTCQTYDVISAYVPEDCEVEFRRACYLASAEEWLAILRDMPEEQAVIMLIGHNPGLHELALRLLHEADPQGVENLAMGLPTAGLVAIACDGPWSQLSSGTLRVYFAP